MSTYQTSTTSPRTDVDVGTLMRTIWRNRGWITAVVLSVGVAAYLAMAQMTPMYTSEAHILIDNGENTYTRPASGETNNQRNRILVDPEAIASQVQVLLSRDLALRVIRELKLDALPEFSKSSNSRSPVRMLLNLIGLAKDPSAAVREERVLNAFIKRLEVYPVRKSRVINVQFSSIDPQVAATVANKIAEAYLQWQQSEKLSENRDASKWLGEQVEELKKKVAASEAAVEKFRSSTGLFAGTNNVTLNSQQLSELNSQLILAKAQRTEAEARAKLITKMLKEKGDIDGASDVLRSNLIQRLSEQRVRVQRQVAELSATLMPSHPRIKELKSELSGVRQQILSEARKVMKGLQNEAQIAGAREASLRASLDEIKKQTSKANENEIELRSLEREAKANRDLLESYLVRLRDASVRSDKLSAPAHASIISTARVADKPSTPKPQIIAALAAVGTAIVLLALIVTIELLSTPRQAMAASTGVAGPTPNPHTMRRRHDDMPGQRIDRRASQAFHQPPQASPINPETVKQLLAQSQGKRGLRVLVAPEYARYGAGPNAVELARALAAGGRSVVLVDNSEDQFGPGSILGLQSQAGLSELMSGQSSFEQVVRRDPQSTVQVISRGLAPGQPGYGAKAPHIFGALDQIYDCVLAYANGANAQAFATEHRDLIGVSVVISDPNAIPRPGEMSMQQWLSGSQLGGMLLVHTAQPQAAPQFQAPPVRQMVAG